MNALIVTDVKVSPAQEHDRERGLLGFVEVTLNNVLVLDGLTLRLSAEGRMYLSYPSKVRGGVRFPYVRPRGDEERRDVERQVFAALKVEDTGR